VQQAPEDPRQTSLLEGRGDHDRAGGGIEAVMVVISTISIIALQALVTFIFGENFTDYLYNMAANYLLGTTPRRLLLSFSPNILADTPGLPPPPELNSIPSSRLSMPTTAFLVTQYRMFSILRASLHRLLTWFKSLFKLAPPVI
jgi:hypothetical protein